MITMKMYLVTNNTDGKLAYRNQNQMYIWESKGEYETMSSDEVATLVATNPQFIKNDWITINEVNNQ